MRSLRSHGRACKCEECILNINSAYCAKRFQTDTGGDIRFNFERIGYSAKMNELEAIVGLGNLEVYGEILEKRRRNLLYLLKEMGRFNRYLFSIKEDSGEKIGPHALPIIIREKAGFSREELVTYLEKKGIDTRNLFWSMPTQCPGFKFLGYKMGDFPNAEYIGNNGIHIGVHQDLKQEQLDYFLEMVETFLAKK